MTVGEGRTLEVKISGMNGKDRVRNKQNHGMDATQRSRCSNCSRFAQPELLGRSELFGARTGSGSHSAGARDSSGLRAGGLARGEARKGCGSRPQCPPHFAGGREETVHVSNSGRHLAQFELNLSMSSHM